MSRGWGAKESGEVDGFSDERMLHEIDVPDEAGEKRAKCKKDSDRIGSERIAVGHGMSDEGRPEAHEDSGDDADDDALAGSRAAAAGEASVGFADQDDGDERAGNACTKKSGISFGLDDVAGD